MTTPPAFHGADRCLLGALAPLSRPGWVEAGRQLLAGMELAVREVNAAGGIDGVPLELVVRDTAGSPDTAVAAVDELERLGVVALVGVYHSAVARAVVARAEGLGLPFLCSSAVIDALADGPVYGTARLPPPQSRGWRVYADCLLGAGHRRIAVASEPSVYWAAGARILREHLAASGGGLVELDGKTRENAGQSALFKVDSDLRFLKSTLPSVFRVCTWTPKHDHAPCVPRRRPLPAWRTGTKNWGQSALLKSTRASGTREGLVTGAVPGKRGKRGPN